MAADMPERKVKRYEQLIELFECFAKGYNDKLQPSEELRLSYVQLYNIVESYFQDVERYKGYHFAQPAESLINDAKICGFMIKWFLRIRPLYVHNEFSVTVQHSADSFDFDDVGLIVNELFCLFLAECFLSVALSEAKLGELLYIFRYRNTDEYALMAIFQMVMDARDRKIVILP
jgi:hypothetical protein